MSENKDGKNTGWDYYWKSLKWLIGNAFAGIFPLLLIAAVSWLTDGSEGESQMEHLIYEGGIVLFVAIAIMGAIAVDFFLSPFKFSGFEVFAIYFFPASLAGFISLEFLLVSLNKLNKHALALTSKKTIILLILTIGYCTLAKAVFYLKEDSRS